MKKFDSDNRIVIRLSNEENEKLNQKIKEMVMNLQSEGFTISFISRAQMCKSLVLSYIKNEVKK